MKTLDSYENDFDKIFKKYVGYQKKNDYTIEKFRLVALDHVADKIEMCSEYSKFKTCLACGTNHFVGTYLCKQRFCFVCAKKRGLSYLFRYGGLLKDYEEDGHELKFITLTLKNMKCLKYMMWKFNNDFHEFRSYKLWKDNVYGAIACREVTYNQLEDSWHFHIHIIAVMNKGSVLSVSDLSADWQRRTKDSYIVDIRNTRKKSIDGKKYNTDFMELFKYPTKLKDFKHIPNKRFLELYECFFKARLISAVGSLYGKVSDNQIEDDINCYDERDLKNLCCAVCECDYFGDLEIKSREVQFKVYKLKLKEDIKKEVAQSKPHK